jgi:hypothetical protein
VLARFAVDPDSLSQPGVRPRQKDSNHRRFLHVWLRYGILMLHARDRDDLLQAIKELPQSSRKLWKSAFEERRYRQVDALSDWRGFRAVDAKEDLAQLGNVELAVLDDEMLDLLEFGETTPFWVNETMEACPYHSVDQSHCTSTIVAKAERMIPKNEPCDAVWAAHFQRLSIAEKSIVVVDRYAIKELCRYPRSGLRTFVKSLDRDGVGVNLTIYSAQVDDLTSAQIRTALNDLFGDLTEGGISLCHAYWPDDSHFARDAHWRYARFGDAVCQLDTGLQVLDEGGVPRNCPFKYHLRDRLVRNTENALRDAALGPDRHWQIP